MVELRWRWQWRWRWRRSALLATAVAVAAAACAPQRYNRRSPMRALAEVAAIDFGPDAMRRRFGELRRPLWAIGGELQRPLHFLADTRRLPQRELQRSERVAKTMAAIAGHELDRLRNLPGSLPTPPTVEQFSIRFAEDLALLPTVLGLDRRPLAEPDDREFRTTPDDTRPEKTFWQRLQRRLFP